MLCPLCHTPAQNGTFRKRVRRGNKVIWIEASCHKCPNCRTSTGPFQFMSHDLEDQNEALAGRVWQEKFEEPIPPPLPGVRLRKLMRTPEGKARVASAFGKVLEQAIAEKKS